jgi:hypothetical protein
VTAEGRPPAHRLDPVGPVLWLVPALALAGLTSAGPLVGIAAAGAAAVVSLGLAWPRLGLGPTVPLLPGVAALGVLAASAPVGPLTELVAGLGGLAVILAGARAAADPGQRWAVSGAAVVPALGLGIALATALLFPPADRLVGVAALFLLGSVAALSILLRRPATACEAEA